MPIVKDTYLGNNKEYIQVHVEYTYKEMSSDSYMPSMELQLKLCIHIGIVYYCENANLLKHRSEDTHAFAIYYQMDYVTKAIHCKEKYTNNLKPDATIPKVGFLILLSVPWT